MVRIASLVLILGLVAPLHAQPAFTRLEPTTKELDASLSTDWYGVYLQGKKIGYFKMLRERMDAGIRESVPMHMKLTSFGQKADMAISQSLIYDPKPPHALRGRIQGRSGPDREPIHDDSHRAGKLDSAQTDGQIVRKKVVQGTRF